MMKRIVFALMFIVMSVSSASCTEYPALGMCTANYVRYRDEAGTDSEILGRIHEYQNVIVLSEARHKGEKWYMIDNPVDDGEAWVSAKYIDIYEPGNESKRLYAFKVSIMQNFGIRPEKTRVLLGKPKRVKKDKFFFEPANQNLKEETLQYDGCLLQYVEDSLSTVEVTKEDYAFGDVHVGDSKQAVLDIFGKPEGGTESDAWLYMINDLEQVYFEFKNDAVTKMSFEHYLD